MPESATARRLVRNEDLDGLVFEAVDRALAGYRGRLKVGTLVRVRAAVVREVTQSLSMGGQPMPAEAPTFVLDAPTMSLPSSTTASELSPTTAADDDLYRELESELARIEVELDSPGRAAG